MTDKTAKLFIKEYENEHIAEDAGILERFARPGIFDLIKNMGKEAITAFRSEPRLFAELGVIAFSTGLVIGAVPLRDRAL